MAIDRPRRQSGSRQRGRQGCRVLWTRRRLRSTQRSLGNGCGIMRWSCVKMTSSWPFPPEHSTWMLCAQADGGGRCPPPPPPPPPSPSLKGPLFHPVRHLQGLYLSGSGPQDQPAGTSDADCCAAWAGCEAQSFHATVRLGKVLSLLYRCSKSRACGSLMQTYRKCALIDCYCTVHAFRLPHS